MIQENTTPAYLFDLNSYAKPDSQRISDARLALGLGHGRDSQTELLTTTLDGQVLTLCLSGHFLVKHADGEAKSHEIILNEWEKARDSLPDAGYSISELFELNTNFKLVSTPWFEWITEGGDPVADILDSISLNPADEINKITQALLGDHTSHSLR